MSELLTDLFKAYYSARKNKRNTHNALKFELCYEHNLIELCDEIKNGRYQPRPSICFIVDKPVKREVFAADFRDRIVHHLIFSYIAPVFEKQFINDNYSCRKGKGTHYGIKRIDHFIRSCSENYRKDCYILKIDIQGYFMSIERTILFEKVKTTLQQRASEVVVDIPLILYLIRLTIFNDPRQGCIMKSKISQWDGLPPSKSLFYAGNNKGLPIGNLTSQLFANIYLDEFDHFMKRVLKLKYYGRYVDDIVVVHQDREYLKTVIKRARDFLLINLQLVLHPRKIYLQHYSKGVVFLGVIIKPYRIFTANRIKANFYNAIENQNRIVGRNKPTNRERSAFITSMNSYLGILKHYQTYKLRKKMIDKYLSVRWEDVFYAKGYCKFIAKKRINKHFLKVV